MKLVNRFLFCLFAVFVALSCAKPRTKDPVPKVEFLDFRNPGISSFSKSDTAVLVLGYEDGDGDLFVDNNSEDNNLVFTTYRHDAATNTFIAEQTTYSPYDTARYVSKIKQPDDGYYKGKSIRGEIHIPLNEFRQSRSTKVLKFVGFLVDQKKHKSNVFSSPVYSLNF
jgi:hypothetical protein